MPWAARRRFLILLIIGAVIAAFLSVVLIATISKAPSCTDGIQNQNEAGIDCGGPCSYLCTAQNQPPTVLYTQALEYGGGRTDIIASIENKNTTAAAKNVPYRITLYGKGQALIQEVTGTVDLPPGVSVPVYVPQIFSGKQAVIGAFLNVATSSVQWFSMTPNQRNVPLVSNTFQGGTLGAPRVQAVLTNPTVTSFSNVRMIVIVHNKNGDVIAASQTVVPSIPAQGQATATFTWSAAFSATPAAIEVVPIIPLPDR
ncbi:MAG: hypothetical protein NUV90_03550 [Candidatus Parcubacteria bacterium]|nr:hypothetical protein [Candidatus Parcubacteria bacterium]